MMINVQTVAVIGSGTMGAQPFGKIISILKLLILMTAHRLPMVNMANCYSPR